MFSSIKVVAFDLDDTLWPCMPTIHRAEKATYEWLKSEYPRVTEVYDERGLWDYRVNFMRSEEKYKIDLSLMRRDMLSQLADEFGYEPRPMADSGFELFYRLRHDVEFYDDVFPVLERLRPHFKLGSISNGNASAGLTPLNDYFDHYLNASDVMVRKPDTPIFESFCETLEIQPEDCLFVGDDPVHDIVGGRQAGMKTVWVNRECKPWEHESPQADSEISNLYQLLELLSLNN